ncbi:MAG TPA: RNA polymerase sigma factor [Acidobacteriota bacterium]|nr:RNA polymerase sigma factor [Acidobacteriota bacterium]
MLIKSRRDLVHRIAARIVGPDEADDVAQLVFIKFWRELPRLPRNIGGAGIDRWLVRVTANKAIDLARHVGRRIKLVERRGMEWAQQPLDEALERGEAARVFIDVAGAIGERQRAAFVLREIEGYATEEVAEILDVAHSTVRNLVHQARQGLRREIRRRFPEYAPADEPHTD